MVTLGLLDVGYEYLNIDDCWNVGLVFTSIFSLILTLDSSTSSALTLDSSTSSISTLNSSTSSILTLINTLPYPCHKSFKECFGKCFDRQGPCNLVQSRIKGIHLAVKVQ